MRRIVYIVVVLVFIPVCAFCEQIIREFKETPDGGEVTYYKGNKIVAIEILDKDDAVINTVGEVIHGRVIQYYENEQLAGEWRYRYGKLDGMFREYYPNGEVKREGNYRDGKKHGVFRAYFEDGTLHSRKSYDNGELYGLVREYYPSGKLKSEDSYRDGKLYGVSRSYYKSGSIESERTYKNGKLTGIVCEYLPAGTLARQWDYTQNRHGITVLKEYDLAGNLWQITKFIDNQAVNVKIFDSEGNLVSEQKK